MSKSQIPINRSRFLPTFIAAFSESHLNRRLGKLAQEALEAIAPVFEPRQAGMTMPEEISLDDTEIRMFRELLAALRHLMLRAEDSTLTAVERRRASRVFSLVLRFALMSYSVMAPDAAFTTKMFGLGSGPEASRMGRRAAELYERRQFGWRKVAKALINEKLLPAHYKGNLEQAAKVAEAAAKPWMIPGPRY